MCLLCILIERENSLPRPRDLVNNVNESGISDEHKVKVYDLALDKANELNMDLLEYTADLAGEIQRDRLRKS